MLSIQQIMDSDVSQSLGDCWNSIETYYLIDEANLVQQLLNTYQIDPEIKNKISGSTHALIRDTRDTKDKITLIEKILLQYDLSTDDGVILMCLAEALIRIPDTHSMNDFIVSKLQQSDWKSEYASDSFLVNASSWSLYLTGKVMRPQTQRCIQIAQSFFQKLSLPAIRAATVQVMKVMSNHYILGTNIQEAIKNASNKSDQYYSYDMLGEAAVSQHCVDNYLRSYLDAIHAVADLKQTSQATVSIKLSALSPRYESTQSDRIFNEMYQIIAQLIQQAKLLDVAITFDAEESYRLELSLKLFEKAFTDVRFRGWGKLGLVVQLYSKRGIPVLSWLNALAHQEQCTLPVRLVKGAYWDNEIKWAQKEGLSGYPVFTRKAATDLNYLVASKWLFSESASKWLRPQFATHNAHTMVSIDAHATHDDYEYQRLHGMGQTIYQCAAPLLKKPIRVYAPVGEYQNLLPYLVRRLLENGANNTFINQIFDEKYLIEELAYCPTKTLTKWAQEGQLPHPKIALPAKIFEPERPNSKGYNIQVDSHINLLEQEVAHYLNKKWQAHSLIMGKREVSDIELVYAAFDSGQQIGKISWSSESSIRYALEKANHYSAFWSQTDIKTRCEMINKLGELLEANAAELIALCHLEAGKTIQDAIDEIREAVDFCYYYSRQAQQMNKANGRGVFACISPWNFPLAIFIGQVSAALLAGNTVIAKPAPQTNLIAMKTFELLLEAGVPPSSAHLILGGSEQGMHILSSPIISGVAFTGSLPTAKVIQKTLYSRPNAPVPIIAETGGQNTMIVDSTALPEQVVLDVVRSAFASAGQRCSALRVLYLQNEIADRVLELLAGAMQELIIGNPCDKATDVGPIIDLNSKTALLEHIQKMKSNYKLISETPLPETLVHQNYVAPIAFEISHINQLAREHFGPILHVIRFDKKDLQGILNDINHTGYGLTFGIHSRNEVFYTQVVKTIEVGNYYINRDQVGAVVGVQPFGGCGYSGTGPKAGGPHYLKYFA
jgi:RHH-type proline utilization regulon transcriptional repressor/proline dehydrogenase/delta 1-pyrroline-5-carboxylate dehydrogenase